MVKKTVLAILESILYYFNFTNVIYSSVKLHAYYYCAVTACSHMFSSSASPLCNLFLIASER